MSSSRICLLKGHSSRFCFSWSCYYGGLLIGGDPCLSLEIPGYRPQVHSSSLTHSTWKLEQLQPDGFPNTETTSLPEESGPKSWFPPSNVVAAAAAAASFLPCGFHPSSLAKNLLCLSNKPDRIVGPLVLSASHSKWENMFASRGRSRGPAS
jgi:hypothetical protein